MLKVFIIFLIIINTFSLYAQTVGKETGLKLPRYVSLKSNDSNLRVGSSKNYPIKLRYIIANIPVEIIDEYKEWRKINDHQGNKGWLHKSLLKGERFALVNAPYHENIQIYNKPKGNVIGKIGKKNIVKVNKCLKYWCHIKFNQYKGWINKVNLWVVYEEEIIKIPFYQPIINQIWKININIAYKKNSTNN